MKNAILMVAAMGMFGGALADSTTVVQHVIANVTNVCTYAVDSQEDVSGKTYSQNSYSLSDYNALKTVDGSVEMGNFYIFRCTSGTNFVKPEKTGVLTLQGAEPAHGSVAGNSSKTLKVEYTITFEDQLDTVNGDIHSAGALFTIPKGQWQSSAGHYMGNLGVTINYN